MLILYEFHLNNYLFSKIMLYNEYITINYKQNKLHITIYI